jgi:hypothetical protein
MKRGVAVLVACVLGSAPRLVRADDVVLRNGGVISNVKVTREGPSFRLTRLHGSSLIPAAEVASVIVRPTLQDELAERKLKAGTDPVALRALSSWCDAKGLPDERDQILALARGIELDKRLEALARVRTARPFLELARAMKAEGGYTASELALVLDKALALEPENVDVRLELGEVKRDGRWVTTAEAAVIDAAHEALVMEARGLVKFEGCWIRPATRDRILARRALEAEQAAEAEAQAQAQAQAQSAGDPPQDDTTVSQGGDDGLTQTDGPPLTDTTDAYAPYWDGTRWVVVVDRDRRRDRANTTPGLTPPNTPTRPAPLAAPARPAPAAPAHASAPAPAPRHETTPAPRPAPEPTRPAPPRASAPTYSPPSSSGSSGTKH